MEALRNLRMTMTFGMHLSLYCSGVHHVLSFIIVCYYCIFVWFYRSGDEKEVEDDVDSDFDIDERDEPVSDHEDEAPKRQRKVVTKAYKVQSHSSNMNFCNNCFSYLSLFDLEYVFENRSRSLKLHPSQAL